MTKIERVVFFGTPEFAVPTLEALVEHGRRPVLVVAQPSRPAGRGREVREPPVAARARQLGIAVAQPERVRHEEFLERMREVAPDVAVVVAFGQIFPPVLLAIPRLGCVNVHASLLPAWRGAAPIQAAIAAGDRETGVTTMRMEAGLDTGPIFLRAATPIGNDETAGELSPRLSRMGADLLLSTLEGLENGTLTATPQEHSLATMAPKLDRAGGRVDWRMAATRIVALQRAYVPWPGCETVLRARPLKVWTARAVALEGEESAHEPGTVLGVVAGALRVAAAAGSAVDLVEVQRPGRRRIGGAEFARGERVRDGDRMDVA